MVQKGRYIDSKKTLYDDFCSIPLAVPATKLVQLELMLKLLGAIINLWFDQDTRDSDNYRMWTQSENLKDLLKELVGITPYKESSVKRKLSGTIVESIRKLFWDAQQEEEESVDPTRNEPELVSGQKSKSFWSAQLLLERHRVKRMREDWRKIVNMFHEVIRYVPDGI